MESQQKVVILLNKKYKKIALIELPLKVQLTNNSYSSKTFASIQYKYLPYEKELGIRYILKKQYTYKNKASYWKLTIFVRQRYFLFAQKQSIISTISKTVI
ncbi:hypothetical protein [Tenacibaculum maritimum]|uniref:hypothetical protein n=1 Tax=Tenacibaculum maritimum TaxID=107401 RepID=UPI0038901B61